MQYFTISSSPGFLKCFGNFIKSASNLFFWQGVNDERGSDLFFTKQIWIPLWCFYLIRHLQNYKKKERLAYTVPVWIQKKISPLFFWVWHCYVTILKCNIVHLSDSTFLLDLNWSTSTDDLPKTLRVCLINHFPNLSDCKDTNLADIHRWLSHV